MLNCSACDGDGYYQAAAFGGGPESHSRINCVVCNPGCLSVAELRRQRSRVGLSTSRGGAAPYRQGAAFERLVIERLGDLLGYSAFRVAGSRGPVDIVAVRPLVVLGYRCKAAPVVLLIQCKAGNAKMLESDQDILKLLAQSCAAIPVLATSRPGEGVRLWRLDLDQEVTD